MSAAKKNGARTTIFVIGADDYNLDLIQRLSGSDQWNVVPILTREQMQPPSGRIDFDSLYRQATELIEDHGDSPDAIIGYLDFPVTSLVNLLIRDFGLVGPTPDAVARCEHKFWMRQIQKKILPDDTPAFAAINPFRPEDGRESLPAFPFWLKPVKGHSSVLGFLVRDEQELESALHECRQKIHHFGEPFNQFLAQLEDVSELSEVDGNFAIAEQLISAPRQFTLEAFVCNGKITVYGAIDSHRQGTHSSSFSRYQYPANLPENVIDRATGITEKFLEAIAFDNSPFNVEFFWDPDQDSLQLLEINPRISKSHAPLFHMVDGESHLRVPIELAMGQKPVMPERNGKDAVAAKFMLRSFEADGVVRRVPTNGELEKLRQILPDIEANILVQQDIRLSSLFFRDSYSYELAEVFLGGRDEEMLEDAFLRCRDSLEFHIQPMPG